MTMLATILALVFVGLLSSSAVATPVACTALVIVVMCVSALMVVFIMWTVMRIPKTPTEAAESKKKQAKDGGGANVLARNKLSKKVVI